MRSVTYQRKVGDQFFQKRLVQTSSLPMQFTGLGILVWQVQTYDCTDNHLCRYHIKKSQNRLWAHLGFCFTVSYSYSLYDPLGGESAHRKPATYTGTREHRINADKLQCLKWYSNPRSQRLGGRMQFMPQTVRPLGHQLRCCLKFNNRNKYIIVKWHVIHVRLKLQTSSSQELNSWDLDQVPKLYSYHVPHMRAQCHYNMDYQYSVTNITFKDQAISQCYTSLQNTIIFRPPL